MTRTKAILSIDQLVEKHKNYKEASKIFEKSQRAETKAEMALGELVESMFDTLGFSKLFNQWYISFDRNYFLQYLEDSDQLAVAKFRNPNEVLYWEIDKSDESQFWDFRAMFDSNLEKKKRISKKKYEKLAPKYKPQKRKMQSIVNQYGS